MYDEVATSSWLREQAQLADQELRAKPRTGAADSILARSCVYGYLYDRYFLETRDLLLNELRWLRAGNKPRAPRNADSVEAFNEARDALLDALIEQFAGDQALPG